jgi:hypothetical protein
MTGPSYDLLVGLHALSAVVGFGAVGVSGTYAARARSAAAPQVHDGLKRYFHPSTNWAERSLLLTPLLGAIVLWAGDSSAVSQTWPWIGLGCWVLAVGIATGLCWPAERKIQAWLADAPVDEEGPVPGEGPVAGLVRGEGPVHGEVPAAGLVEFRDACRALQWGASATSLCFVVAVVAMIWQPR